MEDAVSDWLESQDFYELCQAYRHARDGIGGLPGMQSAAEAFEALKRQIKAQSLSQEAVRDEALEEAAKRCEDEGECNDKVAIDSAKTCAVAIRALKREPNAAAPIGKFRNTDEPQDLEDKFSIDNIKFVKPATPDVASMVRQLERATKYRSGSFAELAPAVARSLERRLSLAQTEIKGHMKIAKEAAERAEKSDRRCNVMSACYDADLAEAQARIAELEGNLALYYSHPGVKWAAAWASCERDRKELEARIAELEKVLSRIAKWFGEFPATGDSWADGSPVSYGAAFGSNGERDFMRGVAREALKSRP